MARGGMEILKMIRDEVERQQIQNVRIQNAGCLGPCEMGPAMVVFGRDSDPDGIWYKQITPSDIDELVSSHLKDGKPLDRARYQW